MNKRRRFSLPVAGGSSLLIMFAVLCLTVFALLGLSTIRSDRRLSDASAEAVDNYYKADRMAEEIYARLRRGEMPEGVTVTDDGIYSYACPISDTLVLQVALRKEGEEWSVLLWQEVSSADWEKDDSLNLWDGGSE